MRSAMLTAAFSALTIERNKQEAEEARRGRAPSTMAPMMNALLRLNALVRLVAHLLRDFDLRLEQRVAAPR